jgi:hypothetical protein
MRRPHAWYYYILVKIFLTHKTAFPILHSPKRKFLSISCPHCGAPYPARDKWDGWGFEYKSKTTTMGSPLLHISFKFRPNRVPVPAKGIIAIGPFGCGIIYISQFGNEQLIFNINDLIKLF